ncbi:MAG: DnaD domain protein, partial [Firmicutes bacterium]|nr:DnaD domain protein [Bacillota bacterium]
KGMASDIEKSEEIIRQIHDKIGRGEVISNQIRSLYRNWSYTLAMPDDVILYALSQSVAAGNPLLYLNRTLENWAEAGAKTLAAVKKQTPQVAQDKVVKEKEEQRTKTRTMKEEEIARIFKLRENKEFRDLDTKHRALVLEAAKLKSEGKNVKELEKEIAVLERKMENIKKKI